MVRRIITFCLLTAMININGNPNDFCKNENIFLQAIYNHPKKALVGGILLTIIGLSLGQNNEYKTTWTQEAVAYSFITAGLLISKTGYNSYTLTT